MATHAVASATRDGVNPEEVLTSSTIRAALDLYPGLVEGSENRPYYTVNDYSLFSKHCNYDLF